MHAAGQGGQVWPVAGGGWRPAHAHGMRTPRFAAEGEPDRRGALGGEPRHSHLRETMQNVLIVIHLIIVIALVGVVLLQRSEGGGLGMGSGGGGAGGFMTGRGQANALTRATAILAGCFFLTSVALAILANQGRVQRSIIDGAPNAGAPAAPTGPSAPNAPAQGGVLDQLRQLQNQGQGGAQPPSPPAAPAQ